MYPLTRFLLLSSLSLLAGCALGTSHVEPAPVSTTASPAINRGHGREVILVAPFEDVREDKLRCGLKKNGFGIETDDVVCNVPPARWVADELAARLSREGYRVLAANAKPGPSTIVIHGSLKKMFVEPHAFVMQGDAAVDLVVSTPSGFRAEKPVVVRIRRPVEMSLEPWQTTIDHTAETLAIDMATAIDDALLKLDGPT